MTTLFTTKIRWLIWAIGATGVVAELAVLAIFSSAIEVSEPMFNDNTLASCPSASHYEFAPVLVRLPLGLSL